jgi:shikimate 5-dehydrogenase
VFAVASKIKRLNKLENKIKSGWWLATAAGIGAVGAYTFLKKSRPEIDFQDKVVLITGGSRGLGLVLARALASEGAKIAICARNQEELNRAIADLEERGAQVSQRFAMSEISPKSCEPSSRFVTITDRLTF